MTNETDLRVLDSILNKTVEVIQKSRDQMFHISEMARAEFNHVKKELGNTEAEAARQIQTVDRLEKEDRAARYWLMVVSRDFHEHTEDEIRDAYDKAARIQVDLALSREKEVQLREKRDDLQRRMRTLKSMVTHAEDLVSRVGVVMDYLTGDLKALSSHVQGWRKRQELAVSVIRAQEEERRRVAREIHDGPAQVLASLAMRLELCEKALDSEPSKARAEVGDLKTIVRASLQDVRKIIFDLRPMALDDLGLFPAIRTYVQAFEERTGVRVTLTVLGDERRLPSTIEVAIYRLIQESLVNVAKHARTSEVWVKVEIASGSLRMVIRDEGVGFDPAAVDLAKGERFGLIGMKERVEMFGGKLTVRSRPGGGTKITVNLPLEEAAAS
ncbi:MAG: sensor histidine kinase [Firmicutes bacterium]|nr:sensor histidine kinase [Bacillota bacterium]